MDDDKTIIQAQKEQIAKYQSRLRDVVTAYKSLLKEKEALDAVLKGKDEEDIENTLIKSLAVLNEEKSKLEANFLNERKVIKQELANKDKEIESLKSKIVSFDRILNDERHLKENLELQLNQLKTQFSQISNSDKIINSLNQELSELRKKIKSYESSKHKEESNLLQSLQSELDALKKENAKNLMIEKQRSNEAYEKNKKITALHEERVEALESRLAELSRSISFFSKQREKDLQSITVLKEKIAHLTKNSQTSDANTEDVTPRNLSSIYQITDEIERLKNILTYENSKLEEPIDLSHIFTYPSNRGDSQVSSEKFAIVQNERDKLKIENDLLKIQLSDQNGHLKTLQEKVVVLNRNIDEYEMELKNKSASLNEELKGERNKFRDTINSLEADSRSKISQLEHQLQKQRERSISLLEEKENEIRALKTTYDMFMPKKSDSGSDDGDQIKKASTSQHLGVILNHPNSNSNIPETYMLFYSNELARKDMELSNIRKSKRESDELIRQTLKEKIMIQEELDEKIANLEQKVYYLDKMKSREGANLEYLKNVTLSYLTTSDLQAKKKMLNAIAAVLKFDENEMQLVTNYCGKKK